MRYLRILWLIISFVILLPLIVIVELWHLIWSIGFAKRNDLSISWAANNWLGMMKQGINMNIDFVNNGL